MLKFEAYENKMPYETSKFSLNDSEEQIRQRQDEHRAWTLEQMRLEGLFKQDALKDVGLEGHPKAHAAYGLAWEYGHASGLYDVYVHLLDLADLLLG